jgi:hypothetical protein
MKYFGKIIANSASDIDEMLSHSARRGMLVQRMSRASNRLHGPGVKD